LGFREQGSESRVQDLGFRFQGPRSRVWGSRFRVSGLCLREDADRILGFRGLFVGGRTADALT